MILQILSSTPRPQKRGVFLDSQIHTFTQLFVLILFFWFCFYKSPPFNKVFATLRVVFIILYALFHSCSLCELFYVNIFAPM